MRKLEIEFFLFWRRIELREVLGNLLLWVVWVWWFVGSIVVIIFGVVVLLFVVLVVVVVVVGVVIVVGVVVVIRVG